MDCEQVMERISARLDQELSPDDSVLNDHLHDCRACDALAHAFHFQDLALRRAFLPRRQAAGRVADRVIAQLRAEQVRARKQPARPGKMPSWSLPRVSQRLAAVLTAVAALVGLGFLLSFLLRTLSGPPRPPDNSQAQAGLPAPAAKDRAMTAQPRSSTPPLQAAAAGQTLHTDPGQRRRFQLADNSILYLNTDTTVRIDAERHLTLTRGEIFLEVSPREQGTKEAAFTVQTAKREVTALGTKFDVRAGDAGTGVLVTQGKVRVTGAADLLHAGEQLAPGTDRPAPAPRASHVLDWIKDLMTAAESPLVPASQYGGGALIAVDPYGQEAKLSLRKYHIDVYVEDGFARTTIDQTYFNHDPFRLEGTFYFPLPPDASLSRLAMYVDGKLMEGGMVERDYARNVYEQIMYSQRDPALLEWVDGSTFKMRVFPLEGRQEKRIILSYTQRLETLYGQSHYRFPSGHSLGLVRDWSFHATVKGGAHLAWNSASHDMKMGVQSGDLLLDSREENIKPDRDVVLDLADNAAVEDEARCASAVADGNKYLMVRYRPALTGQPQRQRRDWVFLFESSGDRDPLLARVQIDVVRTLLANAEHEDTFTLLTAGTFVRPFAPGPLPVTAENVQNALTYLEHTRLVGALDLGRALAAAEPILKAGQNSYLVHVGSGIPAMGEQRQDVLVKRLPEGSTYVGVGVGKRWSQNFMKAAAERTGGYFTQINPDEPVAWRAFDLFSTLNTPRLLNLKVVDNAERAAFLTDAGMLAQGEELCAIARLGPGDNMPASVTVSGTLEGQPLQKVLPVQEVAEHADYLPRTWARLEIDRLLAEDSVKNKDRIISLSKAMYVMTPFTSLLVLENEAMYAQYKVDRGRKDHWAMYPLPDKIPVVYEPEYGQPVDVRNAPRFTDQKPPAGQVMQTIVIRPPVAFLNGPDSQKTDSYGVYLGDGRDGLQAEGTVGQMIIAGKEVTRQNVLRAGGRSSGRQLAIKENHWSLESNGSARGTEVLGATRPGDGGIYGGGEFLFFRQQGQDFDLDQKANTWKESKGSGGPWEIGLRINSPVGFRSGIEGRSGATKDSLLREGGGNLSVNGTLADLRVEPSEPMFDSQFGRPPRGEVAGKLYTIREPALWGQLPSHARAVTFSADGKSQFSERDLARPLIFDARAGRLSQEKEKKAVYRGGRRTPESLGLYDRPILSKIPYSGVEQLREEEFRRAMSVRLQDDAGKVMVSRGDQDTPEPPATADLLYHRPSFSGEERVFFDLVAYAPGMNTSQADIQAVLEAEAAPHLGSGPGRIDPAARKLIDRARQGGWQQLTLLASAGKPVTVFFDGSGRYAYDRVLPLGLHERVVCDGQTLLHLYPELGIGARRTVSRFHRADFTRLVPWLLPPAEDLAHGADLTCMDNRTVAITPRDADSARDADGKPVPYLQTRLLFAADGRLTERRLVEMPSGKVLARETYDADGMVRLLNARDEAVAEDRILLAPARVVPDVKPDTEDLVVLPLPWRTRDHVRQVLKIEQPYQNLDADAALALFAAEFAGQNGSEAVQIYGQRFYNRGKNLLGFYTFLAACGVNVDAEQQFLNILNEHPREPLAEYLAFHSNPDFRRHAHRGEISGPVDGFLQRLADFRVLYMYWQSGRIQSAGAAERRAEQDRALEYVRRNASSLLGWALLCAVQDHTQDDHQFQTAIAETWKLFENAPGLEYLARYERARCLLKAGQEVEARQVFRDLYDRTFQAGYLPPIDGDFRTALQASGQDNPEEWDPLLRRTAAVLVKDGQRPAVIDLAWQAWQLGDQPLADHLLADALDHLTEGPERLKTMVSAIAFLMRTQQYARADNLLQPLLNDKYFSQRAGLWRLGEQIAGQRGQKARARACLEKALEIEYRDLPEVINLQAVRSDYGALLDHYQEVVDAVSTLQLKPPADLGARVIRAADQWRSLDRDGTAACQAAAKILQRLYARDLAWEFLTTPVGLQPNESGPWLALAQSEHQEGDFDLADRAYTAAYEAEPTNAQILWDEAQNLQQAGQAEAAQQVYRRLAEGHWQPRFNTLQAQARWQLGVR